MQSKLQGTSCGLIQEKLGINRRIINKVEGKYFQRKCLSLFNCRKTTQVANLATLAAMLDTNLYFTHHGMAIKIVAAWSARRLR